MRVTSILPCLLMSLAFDPARAELIGHIPSKHGTVYFLTGTGSDCPEDRSALFVQASGRNTDGTPRLHKMPGCWSLPAAGKVVVEWPGLGQTTHDVSAIQRDSKD
jgi:hypothetical protein